MNFLIGTFLLLGLILAINEGQGFPWINFLGVVLVGIAAILSLISHKEED